MPKSRVRIIVGCILLAGCAAPSPTPIVLPPGAGPVAVRTVLPTPPPAPSFPPPAYEPAPCTDGGSCQTVVGRVYDHAGQPVTQRLTVTMAPAEQPNATFATIEVIDGAYRLQVPSNASSLLLSLSGDGFTTRQRLLPTGGRRYSPAGPIESGGPLVGTETVNFGGPSTSEDPDGPVYYMPAPGENGTVVPPNLMLPFERTSVTTLATDPTISTTPTGGLAVGADGRVVVAEAGSNLLNELTPGGVLRVLAGGPHQGERTFNDGRGSEAMFHRPMDVVLDAAGNAYVSDQGNSAIRMVTPDGTVRTLAGGRGYGHADGSAVEAKFWGPNGIALDSRQNVFVADQENSCIRKIAPDGTVTTFAGAPEQGYRNGSGAVARFRRPSRLAIDSADNLFVADTGNHRIRKITPAGTVSDVYGAPRNRADGAVELPAFEALDTVAVDAAGALYTTSHFRVYKIAPDGAVSIMAGYGLYGDEDGPAQVAKFKWLAGIAMGPTGALYVHDDWQGRVRRIQPQP